MHGFRYIRQLVFDVKWNFLPNIYYIFIIAFAYCLTTILFAIIEYILTVKTNIKKIKIRYILVIFCKYSFSLLKFHEKFLKEKKKKTNEIFH